MANFCGGDFHSFPGEGSSRACAAASAGPGGHGRAFGEPQGVSQWGRQQLGSYTSNRGEGGGGGGGKGGYTGGGASFRSDNGPPQCNKMAIQDLSPHLGNIVSRILELRTTYL